MITLFDSLHSVKPSTFGQGLISPAAAHAPVAPGRRSPVPQEARRTRNDEPTWLDVLEVYGGPEARAWGEHVEEQARQAEADTSYEVLHVRFGNERGR